MARPFRTAGRKPPPDAVPTVEPRDRDAWRRWLARHHATAPRVWLVLRKVGPGDGAGFGYAEAVEEALCFGWIDSRPGRVDADRWRLLVSPRKPGSPWSRVNKERVARLLAAGRMTEAGLARVEAARRDGSWDVYETAERLEIPDDLAAALAAAPSARDRFAGFAPSSRKGILWWIASAKTPATRARRIAETARLAALGLRANYPESRGR